MFLCSYYKNSFAQLCSFLNSLKSPNIGHLNDTLRHCPISKCTLNNLHLSICRFFDIGVKIVTNSISIDFSLLLFTDSGLNTFQIYSIMYHIETL